MNEPLTSRHILAYGTLGLPLAMSALPVYVHVPRLYAESAGVGLSLLGVLLLVARIADAGIDPLLGAWSDRSGRRRSLIALALPLLALGMLALLNPPDTGAVPWLMGSMLITYFSFSLISVAYQAWGAEMGQNSSERTRLSACREGFGLAGVVMAAALPGLLSSDPAQGLSRLAWLFPPLLFALAALTLFATPRGQRPRKDPAGPILPALTRSLSDPRFRKLLAVFVVNGVASALPATLVLFFVADVLQAESWGGAYLAVYFISGIAVLPAWIELARRRGRVQAWVVSMVVAIAAFSWAWTLGAGDAWAFALICVLSGAALGADLTLPAALLADLAENGRENASSARAGGYFGWWNLTAKLNLALAAGLSLPLLELSGYRPGESDSTAGLSAVYGLLPLAFKGIAAVLAWRWRHQLEIRS